MRFHHLLLSFALLSGGNVLAQSAGSPSAIAAAPETLASLRAEVTQREATQVDYNHRRDRLLANAQRTNREIDALKAQAAEPTRDRKLQTLLAEAQTRATELEQLDAAIKSTQDALVRARQAIVRRCDRELAAPNLVDAERVELIRLRAVQVAQLVQPMRTAVGAVGSPTANPLDGPRELEEKADLLRDSSDKLRKEARRIATRIDDLERRRHLRERSSAVDEDWFSESTSNRRFARTTTTTTTKNGAESPAFAAQPPGATGGRGGQSDSNGMPAPGGVGGGLENDPHIETATVLRNLVDPATLEELRRADRGDDVERQIRALRRAQGELSELATDLDKKGKTLSKKAQEIRNQK